MNYLEHIKINLPGSPSINKTIEYALKISRENENSKVVFDFNGIQYEIWGDQDSYLVLNSYNNLLKLLNKEYIDNNTSKVCKITSVGVSSNHCWFSRDGSTDKEILNWDGSLPSCYKLIDEKLKKIGPILSSLNEIKESIEILTKEMEKYNA
jgi:hypothetical protein